VGELERGWAAREQEGDGVKDGGPNQKPPSSRGGRGKGKKRGTERLAQQVVEILSGGKAPSLGDQFQSKRKIIDSKNKRMRKKRKKRRGNRRKGGGGKQGKDVTA